MEDTKQDHHVEIDIQKEGKKEKSKKMMKERVAGASKSSLALPSPALRRRAGGALDELFAGI